MLLAVSRTDGYLDLPAGVHTKMVMVRGSHYLNPFRKKMKINKEKYFKHDMILLNLYVTRAETKWFSTSSILKINEVKSRSITKAKRYNNRPQLIECNIMNVLFDQCL